MIDNVKQLRYWLRSKGSIFSDFSKHTLDRGNKRKRRIFIDNNSDVLFVAHLDTVCKPKFMKRTKKRIYASGLDDRLGAMLAYELSNRLRADLLLTDHEESCQTTAQYHECKDYNWIVEFDRAGSDIVTYDLDNPDFLLALSDKWEVGFGSYSDIMDLKTEACCFNLGIGYHRAHSIDSYVDIRQTKKQLVKFAEFFERHKDTKFVRDEQWLYGSDTLYDPDGVCEVCGLAYGESVFGYVVCEDCLSYMMEMQGCYKDDRLMFEDSL